MLQVGMRSSKVLHACMEEGGWPATGNTVLQYAIYAIHGVYTVYMQYLRFVKIPKYALVPTPSM
jgi:hypothetical protein